MSVSSSSAVCQFKLRAMSSLLGRDGRAFRVLRFSAPAAAEGPGSYKWCVRRTGSDGDASTANWEASPVSWVEVVSLSSTLRAAAAAGRMGLGYQHAPFPVSGPLVLGALGQEMVVPFGGGSGES